MKCSMNYKFGTLLRADTPAYIAAIVFKDDGKVQISDQGHLLTSKEDLETLRKFYEMILGSESEKWEMAVEEINGSTTNAKKKIYRRYGLKMPAFNYPSREEWSAVLKRLVSVAERNDFIRELYLTGSLANDDDVPRKDADVLMHVSECPGFENCEVFKRLECFDTKFMGKRVHTPDPSFEIVKAGKNYSMDVFCFDDGEFIELEKGNYRVSKNKKPLFQRSK